jgi:nicotinate-nucleotide adenylyltransferase
MSRSGEEPRAAMSRSGEEPRAAMSRSGEDRKARRLGVMGGTFDPIHNGHLVAASEVADLFDLDEVVFVPTGQPWQKGRYVTAAEDRYLMTVIATASNPRFSVSRVDIDRGGPTYTTDTLRDLHALNPDAELFFITGADALGSILTWQNWEELFSLAHFVGVSRPGYKLDGGHIAAALDSLSDDALTLVEIPALAISSTDCRARASESRPIWYLVPDGVVQYVSKRKLYQGHNGTTRPSLANTARQDGS